MSRPAEQAIRRLKHEYCFAIDSGRYEEWASLFTEDGRFSTGPEDTIEGHEELLAFASEEFDETFETTTHIVTNPVIDVDGSEASGRWYLLFIFVTGDGSVSWSQARYDDRYRRVDGTWRIAESSVTTRLASDG